jgi:hypothetical protein
MTPGARRVTVDSPVTYSPGFFSSFMYHILVKWTEDRQNFRPSTPQFSDDGGKKQAWELSIWDPSTFSLNTFQYPTHLNRILMKRWFSPLHVLIIEFLAPKSALETLSLLTLATIQVAPPQPTFLTTVNLAHNLFDNAAKEQDRTTHPGALRIQRQIHRTTNIRPKMRRRNLHPTNVHPHWFSREHWRSRHCPSNVRRHGSQS